MGLITAAQTLTIAIALLQTSMSVSSTLTAVLTVAPTPLGPTHVAVIQDTGWLPTDMDVKVCS